MTSMRKRHSAASKAKVKSVMQLAGEYGIHLNQLCELGSDRARQSAVAL